MKNTSAWRTEGCKYALSETRQIDDVIHWGITKEFTAHRIKKGRREGGGETVPVHYYRVFTRKKNHLYTPDWNDTTEWFSGKRKILLCSMLARFICLVPRTPLCRIVYGLISAFFPTTVLQLGVYISSWIYENQVALRKRRWVSLALVFCRSRTISKVYNIKTKTVSSRLFSRSRSLFLFSLFSVIFGLIGLINTLVWPSSCEIAVIFIGHVFKNSAIYI